MNAPQHRIDEGVRALKGEATPTAAKRRLLDHLAATRSPRTPLRVVTMAAAFAVLGLAVPLLWPKPALAEELSAMLNQGETSANRTESFYLPDSNGNLRLYMTRAVLGDKSCYRFFGQKVAIRYRSGARVIQDYGNYATIQDETSGQLDNFNNLDRLLSARDDTKTNVSRQNLGRGLVKYTINWIQKSVSGTVEITGEAVSRRPLEERILKGPGAGGVYVWAYGSTRQKDVDYVVKAGKPLYDIDAQRFEFLKLADSTLQSTVVESRKIGLVQVWADEDGKLLVALDGSDGLPEKENAVVSVDGSVGKAGTMAGSPWVNGVWGVVKLRGRSLMFVEAQVGPVGDRIKSLSVPVWFGSGASEVAVFHDIEVHRTGILAFLLAPMNQPFWQEGTQSESGPTSPSR